MKKHILIALTLLCSSASFAADLTTIQENAQAADTAVIEVPRPLSQPAKKALITGIAGQDAAYLARHLLDLGYTVIGTHRRTSTDMSHYFWRLEKLNCLNHPRLHMTTCDITDSTSCFATLQAHPGLNELYNLAAQSFVQESFKNPTATLQINGAGPVFLLEAIRHLSPTTRFYQASTSELFGKVREVPQSETTPFYPRSPYGVAKQYGHWMTINYRESYDLFACCGILFNHESPLRGEEFVSRKVAKAAVKIANEITAGSASEPLELGNIDAQRDWGFAGDYIKAMHLMLQQPTAQEYIIATGKTYTVRYLVEKAFARVGIRIRWEGSGSDEQGFDASTTDRVIVKINPKFYRPAEVDLLIGNPEKAQRELGWVTEVSADDLINMMVDAEKL